MLVAFGYAELLFEILKAPLDSIPDQKMIALGPLEVFITYLKLSLVAGIFLSAPMLLYQFGHFSVPDFMIMRRSGFSLSSFWEPHFL